VQPINNIKSFGMCEIYLKLTSTNDIPISKINLTAVHKIPAAYLNKIKKKFVKCTDELPRFYFVS